MLEEERLDRGIGLEQAVLEQEGAELVDVVELLRFDQLEGFRLDVETSVDSIDQEDEKETIRVALGERTGQNSGEGHVVLRNDRATGRAGHRPLRSLTTPR